MNASTIARGAAFLLLLLLPDPAAGADPIVIRRPEGVAPMVKGEPTDSCAIRLRYDDGTDDDADGGIALGHWSPNEYQFLGVRFTPPPAIDSQVEGASFFAQFWMQPGSIEVEVAQADDPSNSTAASVFVEGPGVWSVRFATPICIPAGKDYVILLCGTPDGGLGVVGEDYSDPDLRSYFSNHLGGLGCTLGQRLDAQDLMVWSVCESARPSLPRSEAGGA